MAMLISSTSAAVAALAALNGVAPAPAEYGAWAADLARPAVVRSFAAPSLKKRVLVHGAQLTADDWALDPFGGWKLHSQTLDASASVSSMAGGVQAIWHVPPSVLELQSFFGVSEDWDGEGAPAPKVASIVNAMTFLSLPQISADAWSSSLHADGRIILEIDSDAIQAELIFGDDGRIALWIDGGGATVSKTVDLQGAAQAFA